MDTRLSLLLVDDEESILFALRDFFERTFDVTCLSSLDEVSSALAEGARWDVVITDLSFESSGTEGLDIIERVHRSSPASHIVLLTAYENPQTHSEALRRGAKMVLGKPYPLPDLARMIVLLTEVPS